MTELAEFREDKDDLFHYDERSPLTAEQQATFTGLRYYPDNPDLVFVVEPEPYPTAERMEMLTSTGDTAIFQRWAKVRFEVDGELAELTIYYDLIAGTLFLPFQDANAGGETYGAGRYLEVHVLQDGGVHIDFNYAYNPYCAYNEGWSCPIPPPENRLSVAIRAGEMNYEDGH